ncbi:MAG TPA: asparagine synthase (glutamine-hydrolyzing) [Pirellulales bacterium]|nr:asparagine synthase (glutamine-hydrolyzing) [Pirellulales bacterium]
MCGIAGILYADAARPIDRATLKRMADAIAHRGPDAEGYWSAPGVGLAHRRLSIIDLAGGDQPIGNEDGSIQVVFNGEIYNYRELRDELLARGHRFRTNSDTEVLVHLYEERGEQLVERLRGMFAFALWDSRQRQLLLGRDRVGIKPLYVYRDGEKLLFGSELKAILACPGVPREVDAEALEDYLALGFVPGGKAIFRRTEKLPPAHVLVVKPDSLGSQARRYWQLHFEADHRLSEGEWREAIQAKVAETVKRHLIADVPVGAFLSGGLDSSLVVSEAAQFSAKRSGVAPGSSPAPLQTFSMGFRETEFSELPFAVQVAERFGTRHVEEIVTPDAVKLVDELAYYYDEPFADSSAVPTFLVSRLARRNVKVVLSGDGGDEGFGGYARYAHDLWEAGLRGRLPRWLRQGALGPLARVWPKLDWLPRPLRAKMLLHNLALEADAAYANTVTLCRMPLRRRLLATDIAAQLNGHLPEICVLRGFATAPAGDALAGMQAADIGLLLPDDFLTKVDRASMASGLEVRPPLVDHELLELAARVPSKWKVRRGETKWILKRCYDSRLPRDAVWRAKHGFEIPVDAWLRGPLRDMFESSVLAPNSRVAELVDQPTVARLYRAHLAKVGRHGGILWAMLALARWADRYLSNSAAAG